jgi:aspartate aminotransferase
MSISLTVKEAMKGSSWIRRMFEAGQGLRQRVGNDAVFDFSLGSPHLEPPAEFVQALRELANRPPPGVHRYMSNAGFLSTRRAVTQSISRREGVTLDADDVLMTVGAAGAIHVALASILDPGDEVIVLAPYFAEYLFYIRHHAGVPKVVQTDADFGLDLAAIDAAIGPRTKAIIVNTPSNPSGVIYSDACMAELSRLLTERERSLGHDIYVVADTPYAQIVFDGHHNPPLLAHHPSTFIAHSFSKELGLAGERIGYLAISPRAPHHDELVTACTFTLRTLGFVNAPALMQLAVERSLDASVDIDEYRRLRDRLCSGLQQAGYAVRPPQGSFYLFLRTPIADDVLFSEEMQKEHVLVVPGVGFGRSGYVRLAFCTTMQVIEGALPCFARVLQRVQAS